MNKPLSFKLLALALLALVLAFAVNQVKWKVQERQATRNGAVSAIADQYAREQQLAGPLLWVKCSEPRTLVETDERGATRQKTVIDDCSRAIRPSQLSGQGNLDVSERYRGIYKARVYLAGIRLHVRIPAYVPKPGQTIEEAHLVFGVSDPRGLKRIKLTAADGKALNAKPDVPGGPFDKGFHVPLDPAQLAHGLTLDAELEIAGSGRLDWAPLAENNDFKLRSSWPHPSFAGQFLPETREIGPSGFAARWRVNDFATGGDRMLADKANGWLSTSLGVSLVDPVDAYTQTDRAVRYGFLFVLLTLGGFFLFELLKGKPVHPLQYLLIGFAVVVFFLLLLALSEHTGFAVAYLIAAAACTLMIASYGRTLLGNWKGAAVLGTGYGLLYFGLYQLLASEDYALLMGAWLIFGVLALTMYLTRRLDWGKAGLAVQNPAADRGQ
jgi:inner membrane protein